VLAMMVTSNMPVLRFDFTDCRITT